VVGVAKNFSDGVVLDNLLFLHTMVQYLCCFNSTEYGIIERIVKHEVLFPGFVVRFSDLHCSQGYGLPNVANVRVQYDSDSQMQLGQYVEQIEDAMIAHGLNVTRRRKEMPPFSRLSRGSGPAISRECISGNGHRMRSL
jgi:hypothetical protein